MRPPDAAGAAEARLDALAAARLAALPLDVADLWSAERCPEAWLDVLAAGFLVPWWDPAWTAVERRRRLAVAIPALRRFGTRRGVEMALEAWDAPFSYRRTGAYRFSVTLTTGSTVRQSEEARLRAWIDRAKRGAAHYDLTLLAGGSVLPLDVAVVATRLRTAFIAGRA